jgi:hypothetical protein
VHLGLGLPEGIALVEYLLLILKLIKHELNSFFDFRVAMAGVVSAVAFSRRKNRMNEKIGC